MEANKKEILRLISNVIVILALCISTFSLLSRRDEPQRNIAKDFKNEFSDFLRIVYDEGYKKLDINYDDPILLSRNIYLTTDLDEMAATEVMMKLKYLENLNSKKEINLYIETSGGYGGIMLSNFIQTLTCPVNTIALDFCSSAGCELLASGTGKRKAFGSSRLTVHIVQEDNSEIDDSTYSSIEQQKKVNIIFWEKYSKLPKEFYAIEENKYYNFTAADALKYGIIDEIL